MECAGQVDGNDGVPAFYREVFHFGHVLDTGVVDQNVHAAKLCRGSSHHGFDVGWLAHVGAVVAHFHPQRSHLGFGSLDITKAIQHDVGALTGQCLCNAQTNAAG